MRRGLLALLVACNPADVPRPAAPPPSAPPRPAAVPARPALPPPRTHAEFTARATPLRCAWQIRCGVTSQSQRERCLKDGDALRERLLGVERGLASGRYYFDPEPASDCLQQLADATCQPDYATAIPGCLSGPVPAGVRPAVAPDRACERWEECVGGRCTGELGCPGTCVAHTPDVDAPCGPDVLCADGMFCDDGTCQLRGDVGATCRGHWQACRPGLVCQGFVARTRQRPEQPGTCEPPRAAGQPCRLLPLGDDCEPDLFCDLQSERPTCRTRLPEGTACTELDACADGLACDGLAYALHATTSGARAVQKPGVCRPFGDHGSPCDPRADATICPADTHCTPAGTCARRGAGGDACVRSSDCLPYHWCDPQRQICVAQAQPGDPCRPGGTAEDGPCFLGDCVRGRCTARCGK